MTPSVVPVNTVSFRIKPLHMKEQEFFMPSKEIQTPLHTITIRHTANIQCGVRSVKLTVVFVNTINHDFPRTVRNTHINFKNMFF
mmetsp:Transcript_33434/g.44322  ORF Transcript_33434/g.44322 Transcript_33434/m.44322 type:complete len:85 (-) Transcript_33434:37-291(-)